jgi:hypothetical protein
MINLEFLSGGRTVPTRKFQTQFWCCRVDNQKKLKSCLVHEIVQSGTTANLHSLTVDISAVMPGFGCSSVVPLVQQKT